MNEKFKYHFENKRRILYKHYFGEITIEDIQTSWDNAKEQNLIPDGTMRFLLDYREATFKMDYREYPKIVEYYRNNMEIFRNSKIAVLTQSEKDIIIPTLVEVKDFGYKSKPFYTEKAAVYWLLQES